MRHAKMKHYARGGSVKGGMGDDEAEEIKDAKEEKMPAGKMAKKKGHYAFGGAVMDGASAKPRMDRGARKAPKKGGGKTNVNVIVAGKGGGDSAPPPMPMGGPDMGPPGPGLGGPPPGAPPMKRGGSVKKPHRAHGGTVRMHAGAGSGEGRMEKMHEYGKHKAKGGRC